MPTSAIAQCRIPPQWQPKPSYSAELVVIIIIHQLVPVPSKVLLHHSMVWRILRTRRILFQRVRHGSLIRKESETSVVIWMVGPGNELGPIATLHDLIVPYGVRLIGRRHGRVVGFAHEVLTEHVETVVDVFSLRRPQLELFRVFESPADDFCSSSSVETVVV